ncbi:MAG TPA: Kdo hydroxylase family protein [Candidatus Acidoferrum sp.]|nr:Kdo hydroxylase family protein [Candidatus Acidoferrum sp.]
MSSAASISPESSPSALMSRLIRVEENSNESPAERGRRLCLELETGNILFFEHTPFDFLQQERDFLLGLKQSNAAFHKNIAYRPAQDRVTGLGKSVGPDFDRLRSILRGYSQRSSAFLGELLPQYCGHWKLDYASFRPLEERGRPARLRARNDLPHVDAFPTRPTNGDRILRLFTNLNPLQSRVWITSQTFEALAARFAQSLGLPSAAPKNAFARAWRFLARAAHVPGARRSPYDEFMHRCHNAMKEDADFQQSCPKQQWEFPPDSTWIVFTDLASHAVLEGQYAMEQTFIISREAMVQPERSPLGILERLAGHTLTF